MRVLDIENIGRIGLMFIQGDLLRDVLVDPLTCDEDDTNYDIPVFNELKKALFKTERLNPDIYLCGVLWRIYPANKRMVTPAVVGRSLPRTGAPAWLINDCPPAMAEAMWQDKNVCITRDDGMATWYLPVKTSAGDVVGALELSERERSAIRDTNYTGT